MFDSVVAMWLSRRLIVYGTKAQKYVFRTSLIYYLLTHSIPNLEKFVAIGFLADGGRHEDRVIEYLKHFDIVISGGSASMQVALKLVEALI